jgi:hypothetical protein
VTAADSIGAQTPTGGNETRAGGQDEVGPVANEDEEHDDSKNEQAVDDESNATESESDSGSTAVEPSAAIE